MIAELASHAETYKETGSTEALAKLYDYLDSHTLYFNKYYSNPNGAGTVTATSNLNGKFENFESSPNFPTPDLLKVNTDNGETVYVLFSELIDQ